MTQKRLADPPAITNGSIPHTFRKVLRNAIVGNQVREPSTLVLFPLERIMDDLVTEGTVRVIRDRSEHVGEKWRRLDLPIPICRKKRFQSTQKKDVPGEEPFLPSSAVLVGVEDWYGQ
jgi:hypothetical protein